VGGCPSSGAVGVRSPPATCADQAKAQVENPVSPHLRAAHEYYKKQVQARENSITEEQIEAPAEAERLQAISVFRSRLEHRRDKGLPAPSDSNRTRAATKIQALFRGYAARRWDARELAREVQRNAGRLDGLLHGHVSSTVSAAGPADMKRRIAFRVIYAARRAFVEYSAALRIQKTWRGWVTRRDIRQEIERVACVTATRLQALVRRCNAVMFGYRREDAAVAIQSAVRRRLARRRAAEVRGFVQLLARIALGYTTRRRLTRHHAAAAALQCIVRGFLARRRLARKHRGVLIFQKVFRSSCCRNHFWKKRGAACQIAALWRGHKVRKDIRWLGAAAVRMQRQFRLARARRWKAQEDWAVQRICAAWKGRGERRAKPFYRSACRIQAAMRGVLLRRHLRRLQPSALRIQSWWRGCMARRRLRTRVALSLVLQKMTRRRLANRELSRAMVATQACQRCAHGQRVRKHLRLLHYQATRWQAWWRSNLVRLRIIRMGCAAQRIQSFFRCQRQRSLFQAKRNSARKIRAGWRSYLLRLRQRREEAAALRIGAVVRRHLCRCKLFAAGRAAQEIQRRWREYRAQQVLKRTLEAAVRIQAVVRARWQRDRFWMLREVLGLGVQALWRQHVARRRYTRQRWLIRRLQALLRGRRCRSALERRKLAAVSIQCEWRRRRVRLWSSLARRSALRLQVFFKGCLERQCIAQQTRAAIVIQTRFRLHAATILVCRRRNAVTRIGRWLKAKAWRRRFLMQRRQIAHLQAFCRGMQIRARFLKARALVDMLKSRWLFKKQAAAIENMQRLFRRVRTMAVLARQVKAATKIQCSVRGNLTRRWLHDRRKAVIKLQALCRARLQRRWFLAAKRVQQCLACLSRMGKARKLVLRDIIAPSYRITSAAKSKLARLHILKMQQAAVQIQRHARGIVVRRHLRRRSVANIPVQSLLRMVLAKKCTEQLRQVAVCSKEQAKRTAESELESNRHRAAIRIQAAARRKTQQRRYLQLKLLVAPRIQATFHMLKCRRYYRKLLGAAITLQTQARRWIAMRRIIRVRNATLRIQKAVRFFLITSATECPEFNRYKKLNFAATCIQAKWRQHSLMWRHMRRKVAVVRIQAMVRAFLAKTKWRAKRHAALRIQVSLLRPWISMGILREKRSLVVQLQAFGRRVLAQRRIRQMHAAALVLQAAWRSALSRMLIFGRRRWAATLLQAYWRMHFQKHVAHPKRIQSLRSLQGGCRRFASLLMIKVRKDAAARIQKRYRLRRCHFRMMRIRWLAVTLQRVWRGRRIRRRVGEALRRLSTIPSRVRGYQWRHRRWPAIMAGATAIQRVFRGRRARMMLQRRRKAATFLQTTWRCLSAKWAWPRRYAALRKIQGAMCRWHHRKKVHAMKSLFVQCTSAYNVFAPRMHTKMAKDSALIFQRVARGKKSRAQLDECQEAAVRLQQGARVFLARRQLQRRFAALVRIQPFVDGAYWRRRRRERLADILRLQAHVKMWVAMRSFEGFRADIINISRCARGRAARRQHKRMRVAAMTIGRRIRCWVAQRQYQRTREAAVFIQKRWRGFLIRSEVREFHECATRIQAAWRMHHKCSKHKRVRWAGQLIVNGVLMWRHVRLYRQRKDAATAIASAWRRYCIEQNLNYMLRAARTIQKWWRDIGINSDYLSFVSEILGTAKVMKNVYYSAHAVKIQRWYRIRRIRPLPARRCVRALVRLQAHVRRRLAAREVELHRLVQGFRLCRLPSRPAVLIKDRHGRLTRAALVEQHAEVLGSPEVGSSSSVAIGAIGAYATSDPQQAIVCNFVDLSAISTRQCGDLTAVATRLQSFAKWRCYIRAVITIQRHCRGRLCRSAVARRCLMAVRIQAQWRRCLAACRVRMLRSAAAEAAAEAAAAAAAAAAASADEEQRLAEEAEADAHALSHGEGIVE